MKTQEQAIFNHTNNEIKLENKTVAYEVINEEPLVVVIHNLVSEELAKNVIEESKGRLKESKISTKEAGKEIRTSNSMFFEKKENQAIEMLEKIAAEVMCIDNEYGEGIQILNYQPGQEFKEHHDYFKKGTKSAENNRISTLIMYLNDVEQGGETAFPELGLSVKPKKGDAVYFEYFYNDEEINEKTKHAGKPVLKGEKWAATQWMHRRKYGENK